ncbi:MAG: hypothetical protein JKY00_11675, partial [Roseicyclus sp.]|nr:hypothetical protein [Roseicyclus sp.]
MNDSADFEKLTEMEARLARALDRIASGLAARQAPNVALLPDTGAGASDQPADHPEVEAARQEAEARAAEMAERVTALESRLAETQDALSEAQGEVTALRAEVADTVDAVPGSDAAALAALEQRLAAAEASRGAAQAELAAHAEQLAEKDAALAELQAALDAAQVVDKPGAEPGAEPDAEPEDMEKALAVMGRRVERARAERDQARTACDTATDVADELREATGTTVDERVLSLRRQLRLMRSRAEDLAAQVALLQSGA